MGDTSGCQISSQNLAVYLQRVSVTPSSNITTEYFVTGSLPSSASLLRVWQFTTQGTITGPDSAIITLDYTQAYENCPLYNITFDGVLNGTFIVHNQVFSAKKFVSYELISAYVLQLTLRVPKTILECYGNTPQSYFLNVNINDAANTPSTNTFVFNTDGSLASYPANTTNTFRNNVLSITFRSTYSSTSNPTFDTSNLTTNVTVSITNRTTSTVTINDASTSDYLATVAAGTSATTTMNNTYAENTNTWSVTQYQTMTGSVFYRIVPTDYIQSTGNQILNIVVSYTNFSYLGTLGSFTSYLDYTVTDGATSTTTVYPTSITFLTGYNVNDSTGATVPLPINESVTNTTTGQTIQPSNVFILPLIQIPSTATFNAGYTVQNTYNSNSYTNYYTIPSSSMSFLQLHIYDNTMTSGSYQGLPLPSATDITVTQSSTSSPFSLVTTEDALNLTVSQFLTLYSISDYTYALYESTSCTTNQTYVPYTTDSTTFLDQNPSTYYTTTSSGTLIYPLIYLQSGPCTPATVYPGYYFSATPGEESTLATSGDYLIASVKANNYSVPGLLYPTGTGSTGPSYSLSYSSSSSQFTVSTNVIPVSPYGNFPPYSYSTSETFSQDLILVNCPSVYVNAEAGGPIPGSGGVQAVDFSNITFPNTITTNTVHSNHSNHPHPSDPSTTPPEPSEPSGPPYPVTEEALAYSLANNFVLTAMDGSLQNSEPKESTDYNEHHVNQGYYYHNHKTPYILHDFIAFTTTFYVTAWAMDGNPILAPVIINVTDFYKNASSIPSYVLQINNNYYQYITSQFLDVYHGLPGTYTVTIQDTNSTTGVTNSTVKTFTYAYFSTPDFPFTTAAFQNNPTIVPPITMST